MSQEWAWKGKTWEELTEEDILEANISKYENDEVVAMYDDEQEGFNYEFLEHEVIFPVVTEFLNRHCPSPLTAIDLCGGAGKAAFVLARCGEYRITLLDSAEKMLEIARRKTEKDGMVCIETVREDALSYLDTTDKSFDVVVFSSAIHHFKDPAALVELAFSRLSERGIMVILGEPTRMIRSRRYRNALTAYAVLHDAGYRKNWLKSISRRLTGRYTPPDERDPAEYHSYLGIDDMELKKDLESRGIRIIQHFRYPAGGPPHIVRLQPYLGLNWVMGMVLSRQPEPELSALLNRVLREKLPYRVTLL